MSTSPTPLAHLDGRVMLTDSGIETDIIFGAGRDLPSFAAFPLLEDEDGRAILERYYLAIALLLRSGSGRLTQEALERQCQLMAQRMSMLYELNSPEFFERALLLLDQFNVFQRAGDLRPKQHGRALGVGQVRLQHPPGDLHHHGPGGQVAQPAAVDVSVEGAQRLRLSIEEVEIGWVGSNCLIDDAPATWADPELTH